MTTRVLFALLCVIAFQFGLYQGILVDLIDSPRPLPRSKMLEGHSVFLHVMIDVASRTRWPVSFEFAQIVSDFSGR